MNELQSISMPEKMCDKDPATELVMTRYRICPECIATVLDEDGYEKTLIRPFQQWRIFEWTQRLIRLWDAQTPPRGDLLRKSFANQIPDGWVPVRCPACESRALGEEAGGIPVARGKTSLVGNIDPDEPPDARDWQLR
jgi:hypothetical protein